MKLAKLNADDVHWVASRMRKRDREEIFATRWDDSTDGLVDDIMRGGEFGFVAGSDDGVPIAAFGAVPVWPGVWEMWMFATDRWPEVAMEVTRFGRDTFFPGLEAAGYHRLQCRSLSTHKVAHRWLKHLGAYKESELPNYGRNGETFHLFCWTRPVQSAHSEAREQHVRTNE